MNETSNVPNVKEVIPNMSETIPSVKDVPTEVGVEAHLPGKYRTLGGRRGTVDYFER